VAVLGLNISGGERGTIPGTYAVDYLYDGLASLTALAALGVTHVVAQLRMERFFATAGATISATELGRLDTFVANVAAAGMTCKLIWHNKGVFRLSGVDYVLGHANYMQAAHASMFGQLAAHYAGNPTVTQIGYSEPHDLSGVAAAFTPTTTRYDWETAAVGGYGVSPYGTGAYGS
jgi:hypothetical protein